ncbi:MAG: cupin domain-containing protein [Firmicutes bacterium]|nr:cupin domain-containing protein [Bacillota bacterium]
MNIPEMSAFPKGNANEAFARFFTEQSYLNILSADQVVIGNVTFEPKCCNNWHIHHADKGGGQILLVTAGEGWHQQWGKPARKLKAGNIVHIPAEIKHWHGSAADSWFQHLAVEVPGENCKTEWCEMVSEEEYK